MKNFIKGVAVAFLAVVAIVLLLPWAIWLVGTVGEKWIAPYWNWVIWQ